MKKKVYSKVQRIAAMFLLAGMLTGCTRGALEDTDFNRENEPEQDSREAVSSDAAEEDALWTEAAVTPFGKYPETVVYTLAKLTTEANSNLPEGDTYEDNAYTRLLKEVLNVQNRDIYEGSDETYYNSVSMMIATGQIADVMVVDEDDMYKMQEKGMLADLTEAFENCASDRIKEIYESYGEGILENCTFEGKLMAIPETNISNGPNLVWIRKDYLDALGLEEPENLADVERIAKAFAEYNIGGSEDQRNIGLACSTDLVGGTGTSAECVMDLVFAAYNAYPKQWIEEEDGTIKYGSVQPEAREALEHLHEMYEDGVIDQDFLIRIWNDIAELIVEGRCGIFFGPWWAPNNPLWEAYEVNPEAEWVPYLISNAEDGSTRYCTQKMTGNYIVVRKGYEHPEIVVKMLSVMFDYMRYSYDDSEGEFEKYYRINVDPTARPLAVNVDYNQALQICYNSLVDTLSGESSEEELPLLERSYYQVCKRYLDNTDKASAEEWSGYTSRITACALLSNGNITEIPVIFPRKTETMTELWYSLEELESEVYLKIIRGEEDITAFDRFVERWYSEGGTEILEEMQSYR